jgi:hypothetical protein
VVIASDPEIEKARERVRLALDAYREAMAGTDVARREKTLNTEPFDVDAALRRLQRNREAPPNHLL